ncbi:hypothetical protein DN594_22390 [Enterobacter cloacae]|nr:hypothetical protein DN594_22390 [Enterobacter cloacae]
MFPGKSFFSAHEVSTCKISGCLSYRILDSGPDGTQTTLTDVVPINEVYNCAERTYWISTEGYFPSSTSEKYALYSSSICC